VALRDLRERNARDRKRDLKMLRLRVVDGASLGEIGTICGLSRERVRLTGSPWGEPGVVRVCHVPLVG
jgi:hypothetical protein